MSETNVQQQLFARAQSIYEWLNVQQIKKGMIIVVQQQETKVQNIKQSGTDWILTFNDPLHGEKMEQIYNAHDNVYTKRP